MHPSAPAVPPWPVRSRRRPTGARPRRRTGRQDASSRVGARGGGHVLEMAGRVGLDRLAVLLDGVGQPAEQVDDEGDDADGQQPAPEDEAEEQQRTRRARRGTGATTGRACGRRAAGRRGRPPAGSARSARCRGRRSAAPRPASRAGSGRARSRRGPASSPPKTSPSRTAGTRRPPRTIGANDGPGMWIPAGVAGCDPLLAARGRAAPCTSRRKTHEQDGHDDDRRRRPAGQRDERAPVGHDELRGRGRGAVPDLFEHRSVRVRSRGGAAIRGHSSRGPGDEHVGHDRHRHAEEEQQRRARAAMSYVRRSGPGRRDGPEDDAR